jgi:hypothetical protein
MQHNEQIGQAERGGFSRIRCKKQLRCLPVQGQCSCDVLAMFLRWSGDGPAIKAWLAYFSPASLVNETLQLLARHLRR